MRLLIAAGTEDCGTHTDHGTAAGDGVLVVIGHTHRQYFNRYIIVFFCRYVNRKVAHFLKKFVVCARIFANWGDGHQSADANILKIPNL